MLDYLLSKEFIFSIIIVIFMIAILSLFKKIGNKNLINEKYKTKNIQLSINIIKHVFKYFIIIIGIIFILHINGINVTSILASLGIVSVIIGLALQDALKDIIMGFNIIFDNFFKVGDVIKFNEIEGKVISFNLKTTRIKDIYNNNTYVIANRNIDKVLNISNQFDIDISLRYEDKIEKIETVISKIIDISKANNSIKNIEYLGIDEFGDSAIKYKIRIYCNPEIKSSIKRYINCIIKTTLDKENIIIPYMQIDIHD